MNAAARKTSEPVSHTPGPWHFSHAHKNDIGFWDAFVYATGTSSVCLVEGAHSTPEARARTESNARLIAAAPDLLAALSAFWKHFDDHYDGDEHPYRHLGGIAEQARAAIAKATEPRP